MKISKESTKIDLLIWGFPTHIKTKYLYHCQSCEYYAYNLEASIAMHTDLFKSMECENFFSCTAYINGVEEGELTCSLSTLSKMSAHYKEQYQIAEKLLYEFLNKQLPIKNIEPITRNGKVLKPTNYIYDSSKKNIYILFSDEKLQEQVELTNCSIFTLKNHSDE